MNALGIKKKAINIMAKGTFRRGGMRVAVKN